MRKITVLLLFLFLSATSAFAANETIEELLAQLEGKTQEEIEQGKQEREQERDEEKFAEELEKERIELKKKLRWQTDKFNGTVGYWSKKTPSGTVDKRSIFFILHDTTSGPLLECRFGFIHDRWIFMQEIRVSIDGETHFIPMFGASDKPHFGWEYEDVGVYSQANRDLYVGIINSERAMVRFFGSTGLVIDFTVSKAQKQALSEVLRYYYIRRYQWNGATHITMEQYLDWVAPIKK